MRTNEGVDFFRFYYGSRSPINLAGKIVLFPLLALMGIGWGLLDLLFTKR